jgi:hypothetical protein
VLIALAVMAFIAGLVLIPIGIWLISNARVPAWMKGIWKWPLGNNVTPTVARLQGWSGVLIGVACLEAAVLVLLPGWIAVFGGLIAMALVGAGSFPWVWSVWLSRTKPA